MKYDVNLVVIGAGSAGLVSAYIAAAVQAKVVLIEKDKMGGDCLNVRKSNSPCLSTMLLDTFVDTCFTDWLCPQQGHSSIGERSLIDA